MFNFEYQNTTKIIFGKDQISALTDQIDPSKKILITYGGGSIKANGVYDQVMKALASHDVLTFGGIEPNPTYETLMQAVTLARKENVDFLLAVGGGSVVDGTKFIAAAIPFTGEDPWDMLAKRVPVEGAVPMGCVLTLPATGSESNIGAVVTRKETKDKLALMHPLLRPLFAVLDPVTTMSLPEKQVSNGVVDAFVHTMEQYVTYPVNAAVQDRFAEGLLQTLIEEGPKALAEPENYDVRANVMWAATWALNGMIGAGVPQDWATHMIGHELTALYGIDHARTLAIVLPALLQHQKDVKKAKLLQFAERVWQINEGTDEARIALAISKTQNFFESLKVPTRLSAYELGDADIEAIINKLEAHGMTKLGEHGAIGLTEAKEILALAK